MRSIKILVFLLLLFPAQAFSEAKRPTPEEWLTLKGKNLIRALSHDSLKKRQEETLLVVSDAFNERELARLALGKYWIELNDEQKQIYSDMFIHYLVATYTNVSLPVDNIEFEIIATIPSNKDLLLKTTVKMNKGVEEGVKVNTKNELLNMSNVNTEMPFFSLNFAIRPTEESYYIRDVQVEGKSILIFLRESLEKQFEKDQYLPDRFLKSLRETIEDSMKIAENLEKLREAQRQKKQ